MVFTGLTFALFENFWLLLFAAIIGVVSATGGDFGPFRSIEESMLSQLTTPGTRADVLAWYVTASAWGSSLGSEVGGRMIENLQRREGWGLKDAYHAVFWMYAGMGVVNIGVVLLLTRECEAEGRGEGRKGYEEIVQEVEEGEEEEDEESDEGSFTMVDDQQHQDRGSADEASSRSPGLLEVSVPTPTNPSTRFDSLRSWILKWTGDISKPTLKVVWKLWVLLAIDSLADGMVPFSLTNYYMVSSQPYLLPSNYHSTQKTIKKPQLTLLSPFLPSPGPKIPPLKIHPRRRNLHKLLPNRHRRPLREPSRQKNRSSEHHGIHTHPLLHLSTPLPIPLNPLDDCRITLHPLGLKQHGSSTSISANCSHCASERTHGCDGDYECIEDVGGDVGADGDGVFGRE